MFISVHFVAELFLYVFTAYLVDCGQVVPDPSGEWGLGNKVKLMQALFRCKILLSNQIAAFSYVVLIPT